MVFIGYPCLIGLSKCHFGFEMLEDDHGPNILLLVLK